MTIDFDNIVGAGSLENGGYVGKYMQIVRAHLNDAKNKREITSAQAGEIYAAAIPAMLKEATAFELTNALSDAQTRGEEAKADALEAQKAVENYKKQMVEVDRDITLDESYKLAKIAELVSARTIAEANATKAVTDKNIAAEQLSMEKEKNGNVGYEYIYSYPTLPFFSFSILSCSAAMFLSVTALVALASAIVLALTSSAILANL